MIKSKIIIGKKIFYVLSTKIADKKRVELKIEWYDLLYELTDSVFPKPDSLTEETENNHVVEIYINNEGLKFLIFSFLFGNKKTFLIHANYQIVIKKNICFNKWSALLECGHSFLMDESIDNSFKTKRMFCSICLEKKNA